MRLLNIFGLGATGQRAERGDTIVEVLIAIAVVSTVLGGAYVTTNRSLQNTRSAQEQSNAVKVVESQLELLKFMGEKTGALKTPPASFCIITTGAAPALANTTDPTRPCDLNTQGVKASASDQPVYRTSITQTSPNIFRLTTTWTDVKGDKVNGDSIQMTYRVYPK